jgi:hypothetical protein
VLRIEDPPHRDRREQQRQSSTGPATMQNYVEGRGVAKPGSNRKEERDEWGRWRFVAAVWSACVATARLLWDLVKAH